MINQFSRNKNNLFAAVEMYTFPRIYQNVEPFVATFQLRMFKFGDLFIDSIGRFYLKYERKVNY